MELYLMAHAASRVLGGRGSLISRHLVGSYVTSLDMAGCSLTVTVLDENLRDLGMLPYIRRRSAGEGSESGPIPRDAGEHCRGMPRHSGSVR